MKISKTYFGFKLSATDAAHRHFQHKTKNIVVTGLYKCILKGYYTLVERFFTTLFNSKTISHLTLLILKPTREPHNLLIFLNFRVTNIVIKGFFANFTILALLQYEMYQKNPKLHPNFHVSNCDHFNSIIFISLYFFEMYPSSMKYG